MTETLTACLARYLEDPEAFERSLGVPVIIFDPGTDDEAKRMSTAQMHAIPKSGRGMPQLGPFDVVQRVESKPKAKPDGRVTVGRTAETDLTIDDPSISRLHAWFELDPKRGWLATDAGSRNGTVVNGARVPGKKLVPLGEHANLGLGKVSVQFFGPTELLRLFKTMQKK